MIHKLRRKISSNLVDRITIIVVYTRTIEAIRAVPKETLIRYEVASCK